MRKEVLKITRPGAERASHPKERRKFKNEKLKERKEKSSLCSQPIPILKTAYGKKNPMQSPTVSMAFSKTW